MATMVGEQPVLLAQHVEHGGSARLLADVEVVHPRDELALEEFEGLFLEATHHEHALGQSFGSGPVEGW